MSRYSLRCSPYYVFLVRPDETAECPLTDLISGRLGDTALTQIDCQLVGPPQWERNGVAVSTDWRCRRRRHAPPKRAGQRHEGQQPDDRDDDDHDDRRSDRRSSGWRRRVRRRCSAAPFRAPGRIASPSLSRQVPSRRRSPRARNTTPARMPPVPKTASTLRTFNNVCSAISAIRLEIRRLVEERFDRRGDVRDDSPSPPARSPVEAASAARAIAQFAPGSRRRRAAAWATRWADTPP